MVPRRLMSPQTVSGEPGSLVRCCGGTISRNESMSQAYAPPPTSKTRSRRVGTCGSSFTVSCSGGGGAATASLIEAKRRQGVHGVRERVLSGDDRESMAKIARQGRAKIQRLSRHGMIECEPGRVQEMPLGRKSGHTTSSAPAIHVVAHDRMADRREMNADLVSPSGMEMGTKKVPRIEPSKAYDVGPGRPTLIDDCHALPVSGAAGDRFVDRHRVLGEGPPGHDRVAPRHPPGSDGRAEQPMRAVGLGNDQES